MKTITASISEIQISTTYKGVDRNYITSEYTEMPVQPQPEWWAAGNRRIEHETKNQNMKTQKRIEISYEIEGEMLTKEYVSHSFEGAYRQFLAEFPKSEIIDAQEIEPSDFSHSTSDNEE